MKNISYLIQNDIEIYNQYYTVCGWCVATRNSVHHEYQQRTIVVVIPFLMKIDELFSCLSNRSKSLASLDENIITTYELTL